MKIKLNNIEINTEQLSTQEKETLLNALTTKKGLWKPKFGDRYWTCYNGYISPSFWGYDDLDKSRWKDGNTFKTEELAQKELDKRIAIQAVKKYIAENDLGWSGESKWWDICMDNQDNSFGYNSHSFAKTYSPFGYLKSQEACEQLVMNQESNLKIIFEV